MNYTPSEKEIFSYELPDGSKASVDPLSIRIELTVATIGNYDKLFVKAMTSEYEPLPENSPPDYQVQLRPDCNKVIVERSQAMAQLCKAASIAFKLPVYNPETKEGYPYAYLWNLILKFDEWLSKKD